MAINISERITALWDSPLSPHVRKPACARPGGCFPRSAATKGGSDWFLGTYEYFLEILSEFELLWPRNCYINLLNLRLQNNVNSTVFIQLLNEDGYLELLMNRYLLTYATVRCRTRPYAVKILQNRTIQRIWKGIFFEISLILWK